MRLLSSYLPEAISLPLLLPRQSVRDCPMEYYTLAAQYSQWPSRPKEPAYQAEPRKIDQAKTRQARGALPMPAATLPSFVARACPRPPMSHGASPWVVVCAPSPGTGKTATNAGTNEILPTIYPHIVK